MTLRNIGRGSEALQVSVNGFASDFTTISGTDTELDLELLDGPLYIGGHPHMADVQVCRHTLNSGVARKCLMVGYVYTEQ